MQAAARALPLGCSLAAGYAFDSRMRSSLLELLPQAGVVEISGCFQAHIENRLIVGRGLQRHFVDEGIGITHLFFWFSMYCFTKG